MVAAANQPFYCQFYQWPAIEAYICGSRVVATTPEELSPVIRAQCPINAYRTGKVLARNLPGNATSWIFNVESAQNYYDFTTVAFSRAPMQNADSTELLETNKDKVGAGCGTRTHDLGIMRPSLYL